MAKRNPPQSYEATGRLRSGGDGMLEAEENGQKCPLFPGFAQRIYWSFPDPASFTGTHLDKLARVCEVRDAIRSRLETWIAELPGHSSRRHVVDSSSHAE